MAGHSLGGTMVAHMMTNPEISKHVDSAHAFAPGASPFLQHKKHPKHMHIHLPAYDPVSFFQKVDTGATYHTHHTDVISHQHWDPEWITAGYWSGYVGNLSSYDIEQNAADTQGQEQGDELR